MKIRLCDYGCGREAKFFFKNGKGCCVERYQDCSEVKRKKIEMSSGENNPNYGKKHSEETLKKMSDGIKKTFSDPEQRKRLSEQNIGRVPWNKGKKTPQEIIDKVKATKLKNNKNKPKKKKFLYCVDCGKELKTGLSCRCKSCSNIFTKSIYPIPIENIENKLCNFGCGEIAKYEFKNKTICCSKGLQFCPEIRKKNSENSKGKPSGMLGKTYDAPKGDKCHGYKGAMDCLYKHYSPLLWMDENRENVLNGKIEVRCKYCGKWFTPKHTNIDCRIRCLETGEGFNDFYCSDECKDLCPTYGQIKYPKSHINNNKLPTVEVSPELRKMVFLRDNYECQKCGSPNSLECHHIQGKAQNPILANDVSNCITFCKECHLKIHQTIPGCSYYDLRRPSCSDNNLNNNLNNNLDQDNLNYSNSSDLTLTF